MPVEPSEEDNSGLQEIFQFNAYSDECILVRCKIMQCRKLVKVEQLRSHVTDYHQLSFENYVQITNLDGNMLSTRQQGHENTRTEVPIALQADVPKTSALNSPQHPLPAASVPTQAVKVTKIPNLSATLSKNAIKGSSEPQSKACKQKFPEKVSEESDYNISRRKTYVVKDHNGLTFTSYTKILPDENESSPFSEGASNLSQDQLISKNNKRQTFVIKPKNVPEETEPAANLNNTFNRELATESRISGDEISPVQKSILKNKRQTFVKKSPLQQNDVLAVRFSKELCAFVNSEPAPVIAENHKNNRVSENLISPPRLQINREHSETDSVAVKSKSVSVVENSKNIEHNANFTSPKSNVRSGSSSKETPNGSNTTKETPENIVSNSIPAYIATKVADVVTTRFTFTSYAEVDEDVDKAGEKSPKKSRGSFLESSGSDCEVMMIEELVDFSAMKPALQKTPIRRQITKNKKRKFTFDGKKGKADVEKKSQREVVNSETAENGLEESSEACQPDTAGVSHDNEVYEINEEINEINDADAVPLMPELNTDDFIITDEIVSRDNFIITDETVNRDNLSNIPFDACAVRKNTTKGPRKTKDKQSASTKNNKDKKAGKAQTGVKKKNKTMCVEMNALNCLTKKVKKRNNVKKNEQSYFDDNSISKFEEVNPTTNVNKTKAAKKEPKSDFLCEKINTHTFLVQAEIHPPPPNSVNVKDKHKNKENEKHNLEHMQVAVVLEDILKSKNIELLNISDKNLLYGKTGAKMKNSTTCVEMDTLNRLPKKVKKGNNVKNEQSYFDDNSISKFEEVNPTTKAHKMKTAKKEPKSDLSCEKIGKNTFLVQAEIHPPPPNSVNVKDKHKNKENEKHNLEHMQVAVVLDDILKSKNIELLNISDKNLLCGKTGAKKKITTCVEMDKKRNNVKKNDSINTNTFLVQAEIHPPPPNSVNVKDKHKNKENEKHDLEHLDDILKSKNIELLNISDRNLLCGKTVSLKTVSPVVKLDPLPASASNFAIDPEESIEKVHCDVALSAEDCNLDAVALIDISHDDLQTEPATDIGVFNKEDEVSDEKSDEEKEMFKDYNDNCWDRSSSLTSAGVNIGINWLKNYSKFGLVSFKPPPKFGKSPQPPIKNKFKITQPSNMSNKAVGTMLSEEEESNYVLVARTKGLSSDKSTDNPEEDLKPDDHRNIPPTPKPSKNRVKHSAAPITPNKEQPDLAKYKNYSNPSVSTTPVEPHPTKKLNMDKSDSTSVINRKFSFKDNYLKFNVPHTLSIKQQDKSRDEMLRKVELPDANKEPFKQPILSPISFLNQSAIQQTSVPKPNNIHTVQAVKALIRTSNGNQQM